MECLNETLQSLLWDYGKRDTYIFQKMLDIMMIQQKSIKIYGGPKSDMMTIIKIQSSQNSVWKIKNCNIHKVIITYSIHPK